MSRESNLPPKLAVSVFNAEEVRAAVAGGVDIIDCEDPRAPIGMFEPRVVTEIAYAVRRASPMQPRPTSANIGVPEVFKRAGARRAALRTPIEIQAKAAQEALGLAAAMDVGDGRPNVIKFEVDGLRAGMVGSFVSAVRDAVRNSRQFQDHLLVASCLELNREVWAARRSDGAVIGELLRLGEFYFDEGGVIDLNDHLSAAEVQQMMDGRSETPRVNLIEPSNPEDLDLPTDLEDRLKFWVETMTKAGAGAVMIDTPIQAKIAKVCLLASADQAVPAAAAMPLVGTIDVAMLDRFASYCAYLGAECWLAGSIQPEHAGVLGQLRDLDVIMCRGSASAEVQNPYGGAVGADRGSKRISEARVSELVKRIKGA